MTTQQPPLPGSSPDEMFPNLTPEQQRRVLSHGHTREIVAGETLVELNQQPTKFFVVVEGKLELCRLIDNKRTSLCSVWTGNVKRVASAVGEGSIAISFVHQILAQ